MTKFSFKSMFAADDAFWFVYLVSTADGDKKKRQKGKGTPEPSVILPTKLATLQVLTLRYLQAMRSNRKTRKVSLLSVGASTVLEFVIVNLGSNSDSVFVSFPAAVQQGVGGRIWEFQRLGKHI